MSKEDILKGKLDEQELENVSGGCSDHTHDKNPNNCYNCYFHNIYNGTGIADCAATVEENSHCVTNDACYQNAVVYWNMSECKKAWL